MVLKGYIYCGFKFVYWSLSFKIVFVEVELEYFEGYKFWSIYVVFKIINLVKVVEKFFEFYLEKFWVVIWIIIFWIIFGNLVVSVNLDFNYVVVKFDVDYVMGKDKLFIVVVEVVECLLVILGIILIFVVMVKGEDLENCIY